MRISVLIFSLFISSTLLAQKELPAATSNPATTQSADPAGVDTIIELVKANMSEDLVVKTIQKKGQPYDLSPSDLLKLQKANVSERIISTMLDPGASAPSATGPSPAAVTASPATPATPAAESGNNKSQPAAKNQKSNGGMFSSLQDRLGKTANDAVDRVDKEVQGNPKPASAAANKAGTSVAKPATSAAALAPAANQAAATSTDTKTVQDLLDQIQKTTAQQGQLSAADRQKQAQKNTACRQQASKAHPEGGTELLKAYLACIQAP